MAQQTEAEHPFQTAADATVAGVGTENQRHPAPPTGTAGTGDPNQKDTHHHEHEDWDLTDEDALPEGSNLLGNKSLMEQYHENKENFKKTKKTNTGKGKKGNPKNKK